MPEQRRHQQCTPARHRADNTFTARSLIDQPHAMRVGKHFQRAVVWPAGVQVQPKGQGLTQHINRRLHLHDSVLFRPRPVAICIDSALHGDLAVLMPGHKPVAPGLLVKEKNTHRPGLRAERRVDHMSYFRRPSNAPHRLEAKQITHTTPAGPSTLIHRWRRQTASQLITHRMRDHGAQYGLTIRCNPIDGCRIFG